MSAQKKSFATENHVLRAAQQAEVRICSKTKENVKRNCSRLFFLASIPFCILL